MPEKPRLIDNRSPVVSARLPEDMVSAIEAKSLRDSTSFAEALRTLVEWGLEAEEVNLPPRLPRLPGTPVPISIRGTTYPSMSHAARALNLSLSTIRDALERGTLDNAGSRKWNSSSSSSPSSSSSSSSPSSTPRKDFK